ncbi:MAG: hypothetical protein CM15mP45_13970 [Deltaproteobacteria bacterium]|nr:MAG: hypothetical protein CM15mP45_13970 [Deltaproteobacteria bacterium]
MPEVAESRILTWICFVSAQNPQIGSDGLEATLKCILLVILHEGHACLKLQNLLYVQEFSVLGFCVSAFRLSAE